jgi:hypothetical protein
MRRTVFAVLALAVLAPFAVAAQETEEQETPQVYTALYKIGYADMEEWIRVYHEVSVPILEELQEEGIIQGWNVWQHQTGGEYNWRFAVRATQWAQFGQFWEQYLGRLAERFPDDLARSAEMIRAHKDEIWDITGVHFPDPPPATQYVYDARYQLSFSDMDAWNSTWEEVLAPALEQAMADGVLGGWVTEGHNTGGRFNWKVLYMFEEWDDMDDLFSRLTAAITADPEVWQRVGGMIKAHDDVIWSMVPEPEEGM